MMTYGKYEGRTACAVRPRENEPRSLFHVAADELRHLEHRDFPLAAEHHAKLVVRVDHAALLGVLEPVPLDVLPQLLRHLGTGHRTAADNRGEGAVGTHGSHERRVRLALRATTLCALTRCLSGALSRTLLRTTLLPPLRRHAF